MPQIGPAVARARAADLRAAVATRRAKWLATQVGHVVPTLVELAGDHGHAPDFAGVHIDRRVEPRRIHAIRITGHDGNALSGTPA